MVQALVCGSYEPASQLRQVRVEPTVDEGVEVGPDQLEYGKVLGLLQRVPGEHDDTEAACLRELQEPGQSLGLLKRLPAKHRDALDTRGAGPVEQLDEVCG